MKIYSTINQPQIPSPHQLNTEQYSFQGASISPPHERYPESKNKNKFSFRLQPQKYFQKVQQQLSTLYSHPSHIKLEDEEKEPNQKAHARKKIFGENFRVVSLIDTPIQEASKNISPNLEIPARSEDWLKNSKSRGGQEIINKSLANFIKPSTIQPIFTGQNSKTNAILANPILLTSKIQIHRKPAQQSPFLEDYPRIIKKVEDHDKQIADLTQRMLQYQTNQKTVLQNTTHQKQKLNEGVKLDQQNRRALQIQQQKRLKLLIQENKHLCSEVLRINSKKERQIIEQDQRIESRINGLKRARQMQRSAPQDNRPSKLNGLDISIIPQTALSPRLSLEPYKINIPGSIPTSKAPRQSKRIYQKGQSQQNQKQNETWTAFQKRSVAITKIY